MEQKLYQTQTDEDLIDWISVENTEFEGTELQFPETFEPDLNVFDENANDMTQAGDEQANFIKYKNLCRHRSKTVEYVCSHK